MYCFTGLSYDEITGADFEERLKSIGFSTMFGIHGIKGFVIPTKPFLKVGITKNFCYNN